MSNKQHYKSYKAGKLWLTAGVGALGLTVGLTAGTANAHADETDGSISTAQQDINNQLKYTKGNTFALPTNVDTTAPAATTSSNSIADKEKAALDAGADANKASNDKQAADKTYAELQKQADDAKAKAAAADKASDEANKKRAAAEKAYNDAVKQADQEKYDKTQAELLKAQADNITVGNSDKKAHPYPSGAKIPITITIKGAGQTYHPGDKIDVNFATQDGKNADFIDSKSNIDEGNTKTKGSLTTTGTSFTYTFNQNAYVAKSEKYTIKVNLFVKPNTPEQNALNFTGTFTPTGSDKKANVDLGAVHVVSVGDTKKDLDKASTAASTSDSASKSASESKASSESAAKSTADSASASTSGSIAGSKDASTSAANSASTAGSIAGSAAASTSAAKSASTAGSIAASTIASTSAANSASTSGSIAGSTAASTSTSTSAANDPVTSASMSASTAASTSASISASTAASTSASLSTAQAADSQNPEHGHKHKGGHKKPAAQYKGALPNTAKTAENNGSAEAAGAVALGLGISAASYAFFTNKKKKS